MNVKPDTGESRAASSVNDTATLPKVAMLIPERTRQQVLPPEAERELASFAEVINPAQENIAESDLSGMLQGSVACLTGWGTPPLSDALLSQCPELRLVAHTAGSIRRLIPSSAWERGVRVSHAAAIIADAVAEFVISQALTCLRHTHEIDRDMKAGANWGDVKSGYSPGLLGNRTVGVVSVGRVGGTVIRLLKAFGCRVLAYDPYLDAERAAQLGVEAVGLDELFSSADIVTVHAPVLPETKGMIGDAQLALLRDGAIFINTARAVLVDEQALLGELQSGRIVAALDVFNQEPLPEDSPFRALPNVLLSPHVAGRTVETYLRQGEAMVAEVRRLLQGKPLQYEIRQEMVDIIA